MTDNYFDQPEKIRQIIGASNRLKYLLDKTYAISWEDIQSVRVDQEKTKVEIHTNRHHLGFKVKGQENVLRSMPGKEELRLQFDPALAQGILQIVHQFAST